MNASLASGGLGGDPLLTPRPPVADAGFDVTAMVDLVFMMNIFFLLAWVNAALAEVDLPAARHCTAAELERSVMFTVMATGDRQNAIYLGERREGKLIKDDAQLDEHIRQAVDEAKGKGLDTVLIKAEKDIPLRQIVRLATAATAVEGMSLKLAVLEKE